MAIGFVDKDVIEQGPYLDRFSVVVDIDPSIIENVRQYFATLDNSQHWFMAEGVEKTLADGQVVYDINGDTRNARERFDDGTLATKTVTDDDGNTTTQPKYTSLQPGRKYISYITYTSTAIAELPAVGSRAEVLIRPAAPILD